MKIGAIHSHLNGLEWIHYHHKDVWLEIRDLILALDISKHLTKVSKEKTKLGNLLYNPTEINKALKDEFEKLNWKESRTSYWVTDDYDLITKTIHLEKDKQKAEIEAAGKKPISSYNQTDFVKNRIAVEVQFGKYSFIAYDLFVKHLAFYVGNTIDIGIEILPMKTMQSLMSSGPGYYESALYDLARQGRGVPSVPLILIGVEP